VLAIGERILRRVLVIGEGPDQVKALAFRLGLLGFESAASASDLTLAVRSILSFKPQLVLLDSSAVKDAHALFQFIYDVADISIVVLGDTRHEDELVWYLGNGAADYISRAVSETILSARIAAILRRSAAVEPSDVLRVGSLEVDAEQYQVRKAGEPISLTPTEFRVLRVLAENAGKPCSHKMLLERVWGDDFGQCSHYLRLYVGYLRQKIEDNPKKPRHLLTEWGIGYRLVPDVPSVERRIPRRARALPA